MSPKPVSFEESAYRKALGARVRALRGDLGWTQEQLVEASGLDRSYIAQIENGSRNPTLGTLIKLAQGLRVTVRELFS